MFKTTLLCSDLWVAITSKGWPTYHCTI